MIPSGILSELTSKLSNCIVVSQVSQSAFMEVGKYLGITRIEIGFEIDPTKFTKDGETKNTLIYRDGTAYSENPPYTRSYKTDDGGTVTISFYLSEDNSPEHKEEESDLQILADVIFIACGRWRLVEKLQKSYLTDALTGLPNTGGYLVNSEKLFRQGKLPEYTSFYFNLAHFGLVNEKFGNRETNEILARYAHKLSSYLVDGECLGHLGGDNFVALIFKDRVTTFLNLLAGIDTFGIIGSENIPVRISAVAGIFDIDKNIATSGSVIGDASVALNEARYVRKCHYVLADKEMNERALRTKQLIARFSDGIKNEEFLVYYQPKVRAEDGTLIGAEALSRWKLGNDILMPGDFIPIFEQNGMVRTLDFYVLEHTCMAIREWIGKGIDPVRVSVNFSRKHLGDDQLVERIISTVDKYKIDHRYIEIEVTETVNKAEASMLSDFINGLRKSGIAVSIDDFGTGYSSLTMLRSFPVDVVKLDREFITSLDERDKKVVENVIHMVDDLDMQTIAEGVETAEQLGYLTSIGCHLVQGFLFDRPIPGDRFEERLKRRKYELT